MTRKTIIVTIMIIVLLVDSIAVNANESTSIANIVTSKDAIDESINLVIRLAKNSYAKIKDEFSSEIIKEGADLTLSMESFNRVTNPYKNLDPKLILAIYLVAKENAIDLSLENTNFFKIETKVRTESLPKPIIIDEYERVDSYYVKIGSELITEEKWVREYLEIGNGKYVLGGLKKIMPTNEDIKYLESHVKVLGVLELMGASGLCEDREDRVNEVYSKIDKILNGENIIESRVIKFRQGKENLIDMNIERLNELIETASSDFKKELIINAVNLVGEVPYEWGGKARIPGVDVKWWTFNDNGNQVGLDCSGFVQWAYLTSGADKETIDRLISTRSTLNNFKDIEKSDLEMGDLGLLNRGDGINHVGIYVGDGKYIHCSSTKGTVVLESYDFKYFKRIESTNEINIESSVDKLEDIRYNCDINLQDRDNKSDIMLLAGLIEAEGGGEGLNGWVGIGEVVLNRVSSLDFPNTIEEVIKQKGQFAKPSEMPREEIIKTAREIITNKIKVFDNKEVCYFRNPIITSGIKADVNEPWGDKAWYGSIGNHAFYTKQLN